MSKRSPYILWLLLALLPWSAAAAEQHSGWPMLGFLPEDFRSSDGIRLLDVIPESGAAAAGLHAGDLITAINGQRLDAGGNSMQAMHEAMASVQVGETVAVEFVRDGGIQVVDVPIQAGGTFAVEMRRNGGVDLTGLEQIETGPVAGRLAHPAGQASLSSVVEVSTLGIVRLEDVQGDLARYFGVDKGVLVMAVPEDSPLKGGDVLLSLDNEAVASAHGAYSQLAAAQMPIAAVVLRENQRLDLELPAGMPGLAQPGMIRLRNGAFEASAAAVGVTP